MKKLLIVLMLAYSGFIRAQCIIRFMESSDTLTTPRYKEIKNSKENIEDSIKIRHPRIDFDREFTEKKAKDGSITIHFQVKNNNKDGLQFPLHLTHKVTSDINFAVDHVKYSWKNYLGCEYDRIDIFVSHDTLYSIVNPAEAGGVTPEGHRFIFEGNNIRKIESKRNSLCLFFKEL